jgi:hypothetical protein
MGLVPLAGMLVALPVGQYPSARYVGAKSQITILTGISQQAEMFSSVEWMRRVLRIVEN